MTTTLSVLICTVQQRKMFFMRLSKLLNTIVTPHPDVEILHENDLGLMSIGEKRNKLANRAQGTYSVFIDDDDLVDTNYFNYIMPILREGKVDGVGFKGLIYTNNTSPKTFIHKFGYEFGEKDGVYLRPLNHLNPVRTEIMRQIPFPHINHAEDTDYATRLTKSELVSSTDFIDNYLYYYYFRPQKPELPHRLKRK